MRLPERTVELLALLASDLEQVSLTGDLRLPTLESLQEDERTDVAAQAARILNGFLEAGEDVQRDVLRTGR